MNDQAWSGTDRLLSLTIDGFRGVSGVQRYDLDASAVLIWGPNGTGKTTIFDAFLWLFEGDVPRLRVLRLRKNEEYLVSTYSDRGLARVTLELMCDNRVMEIQRIGDSSSSWLEIKDGVERLAGDKAQSLLERVFTAGGAISLPEAVKSTGLLQQDDLRALLHDKPDDRYTKLQAMLGLDVLSAFEVQSRRDAKSLLGLSHEVEAELELLTSRLSEIEEQIRAREMTRPELPSHVPPDLRENPVVRELTGESDSIEGLAQAVAEARSRSDQLTELGESLQRLEPSLPTVPDVVPLRTSVETVRADLALATSDLRAAQVALSRAQDARSALEDLVALAAPLLGMGRDDGGLTDCPICETRIDAVTVLERLRSRAAAGLELAELEGALHETQARVTQLGFELDLAQNQLAQAENARRFRLDAVGLDARIVAQLRDIARASWASFGLASFYESLADNEEARHSQIAGRVGTLLGEITELDSAMREAVRMMERAMSARAAHVGAIARGSDLPRLRATQQTLAAQVEDARDRQMRARKRALDASRFSDLVTDSAQSVVSERFSTIGPVMNEIFRRLDPHPTFRQLGFSVETYRKRGTVTPTVTDLFRDVRANPSLIFSSAQANMVAISAFLALGWAAGDNALPFVLLDDPLQALDDVNVLGFADLARNLRRQRQVILATHEERFAQMLQRKLTGRRVGEDLIVHRFTGWDREGPRVVSRKVFPVISSERRLASA